MVDAVGRAVLHTQVVGARLEVGREAGRGSVEAAGGESEECHDPQPAFSRLFDQPRRDRVIAIPEDGHRRLHRQEAELLVEAFLARIRVQDDLAV